MRIDRTRRRDAGESPAASVRRGGSGQADAAAEFRVDRDRIAASPFFARLGGVTQVVSAADSGLLHNRLTHSLKVAQVARTIAERLTASPEHARLCEKLGGCDPDVAEAAALAHDLGHPPFGHLGEQVLDRIARHRLGLADGFEGNAQTFRILTTTDVRGPSGVGLDLTAAVRAAVLKYPWLRLPIHRPHPSEMEVPPRGAAEPADAPGTGSSKFSAYVTEVGDLLQAREPFADKIEPWQQTLEASVMDTADDIAYAIHDLQDFHRIGVLQHAPVAGELRAWAEQAHQLRELDDAQLSGSRKPGHSLERLRRRMHVKDKPLVDDDAFHAAVARVRETLVDGLLARAFDGSIESEQAIAAFSEQWHERLVDGVEVVAAPSTRSGHVTLRPEQWHEVQVLKFVHKRFVLERADLALHQRGQASLLSTLVDELRQWLLDEREAHRIPRRLHDLVELAEAEYAQLVRDHPDLVSGPGSGPVDVGSLARGRSIVDFVASLTDKQAVVLLDALAGRSTAPWSDSFVL
ncbi:deoxyguanosinetriphosphate triphosphohydrolase family protein [Thermocrispum agreste]|uniref:deoxyguanosinetriphosphate triphosphohydrolase family protein n=1 Tax=Thermocrispum agreste TaxID=37925 RepID=UPI000A04EE9D|nr:dNTP triphosphohydrolase [Thermocrispum agreste]